MRSLADRHGAIWGTDFNFGVSSMPIRHFLGSRAFSPQLVHEMGDAFEVACSALNLDPSEPDATTRHVADMVIMAAEGGKIDCVSILAFVADELGIISPSPPEKPAA